MATVIKRKTKFYVVYYYTDGKGNKKQKWETWGTQKEADKRKTEIDYRQDNHTFIPPSVKTVSDLLYDFVELYGVNKWALSTYSAKKALIDNYVNPFIGDLKLSDVTPKIMDEYYKNLLKVKAVIRNHHTDNGACVSKRNVKEIHKILRCAFNQAKKWGDISVNPVENAILPESKPHRREIWDPDTLLKALKLCKDDMLLLCMNLSFACSLRIGEVTGLTWDCVDIGEKSIAENNASVYIEKELQRVTKDAMQKLENRDIIKIFPPVMAGGNTSLVLKTPKTESSIRRVWLPNTVGMLLGRIKKSQDEIKEALGEEYQDYNLVVALTNGRPVEERLICKAFHKLIVDNDLPLVVFHSLRHTSTTYKLKMSGGDVKAVQGDTGHAEADMVTNVYSHILDGDRRRNAMRMEKTFYQASETKVTDNLAISAKDQATKIVEMVQNSPELAAQLYQVLGSLAEDSVRKNESQN